MASIWCGQFGYDRQSDMRRILDHVYHILVLMTHHTHTIDLNNNIHLQ